jgi:NTE family protein
MRRFTFIIICILLTHSLLNSQNVGLVLSGGGAKGITHIGIIKALEENGIPIDYVTGTSMGAIVGSMYAMGLTTDQMVAILKSSDFKRWSTGDIEAKYKYFYRTEDSKPSFVEIPFKIQNLDSLDIKVKLWPTNIVSPVQMNYAFVPLFAQASAAAGGNFDRLMVPFRCVASDIYNKKAVTFRYGDLGDAVRASMTFPFMFKPITIDNKLLFDGGIFNNFPVDVMKSDFNPDVMIGSVVANNPRKPDENDIVMQIENMIMSRTNYTFPPSEGVLLKFETTNVKLFDFSKVDELVQMGYDSTLAHMPEIKARISRRISPIEMTEKRKKFITSYPELKFQNVIVTGVDSLQRKYVEQGLHYGNRVFSLQEFKEAYFKLISDEKIKEVIPHARYNSACGNFDLLLQVKTEDKLKIALGGNISSSNSNQAYFGLTYQNLTEYAQTAYIDAQFGHLYNGIGIGTRIEIPTQKSWYMKLAMVYHKFEYSNSNEIFYTDYQTSNFTKNELYSKLSIGFPLTLKGRLEFGLGYGGLTDYYVHDPNNVSSSSKEDKNIFSLGNVFGRIESSTLDNIMYPTVGFNYSTSLQLFAGEESFNSFEIPASNFSERGDLWIQYKAKFEQYFPLNSKFTLGAYGELAFSTRKILDNYTVTMIEAPTFAPTPHSKSLFNSAFAANQFLALGVKPIYKLTKQLHLRGEVYWFLPYQNINRATDNLAYYSPPFSTSQFLAETSLVFNFKIASAAMFANYYSTGVSQWNFGINIGFLLFNPKFTD